MSVLAMAILFVWTEADLQQGRALNPPPELVLTWETTEEELDGIIENWGPEAVSSIIAAHKNANSEEQAQCALRVLDRFDTPAARDFLLAEVEAAIGAGEYERLVFLANLSSVEPKRKEIDAELLARFNQLCDLSARPEDRLPFRLCAYLGWAAPDVMADRALHDPEAKVRRACAFAVGDRDPYKRRELQRRLLAETKDDDVRKSLEESLAMEARKFRAREQMEAQSDRPLVMQSSPNAAPSAPRGNPPRIVRGESVIQGRIFVEPGRELASCWVYLVPDCGSVGTLVAPSGRFVLPYSEAGQAQIRVYGFKRIGFRAIPLHSTVLQGPTLTLQPGTRIDEVEVWVSQEASLIVSDTGATDRIFLPQNARPIVHRLSKKWLMLTDLPRPPFWIEATRPACAARIARGDLYPLYQPWQQRYSAPFDAVNEYEYERWKRALVRDGRLFATQEGGPPLGTAVMARMDWYEAIRSGSQEPPPGAPPRREAAGFSVHVVDNLGKPVTRIQAVRASPRILLPYLLLDPPPVEALSEAVTMESEDGVYRLGDFVGLIGAPGLSREYVATPENPSIAPLTLMLFPASRIRIEVAGDGSTNANRAPIVLPVNDIDYPAGSILPQGSTVQFSGVAPGEFFFLIVPSPDQTGYDWAFLRAQVAPGSEVVLKPKDWQYHALLDPAWRSDEGVEPDMAPYLEEAWKNTPVQFEMASRHVRRLAELSQKIGTRALIPLLKERVLQMPGNWARVWSDPELMDALIFLAGEDLVEWLVENATTDRNAYNVRCDCLMALGRLGTTKSVEAFLGLRDVAYGASGAPAPKKSYTHAEKMAETAKMTMEIMPGPPPYEGFTLERLVQGACVDESGDTGSVSYDPGTESGMGLRLRRFGSEWLVVDFEPGC